MLKIYVNSAVKKPFVKKVSSVAKAKNTSLKTATLSSSYSIFDTITAFSSWSFEMLVKKLVNGTDLEITEAMHKHMGYPTRVKEELVILPDGTPAIEVSNPDRTSSLGEKVKA